MLPEKSDAECAVCARERPFQALRVIDICRHHFGTGVGQGARLFGPDVSRERARLKRARLVGQDGANQAAALRPGCPDYGNDLFLVVGHFNFP